MKKILIYLIILSGSRTYCSAKSDEFFKAFVSKLSVIALRTSISCGKENLKKEQENHRRLFNQFKQIEIDFKKHALEILKTKKLKSKVYDSIKYL